MAPSLDLNNDSLRKFKVLQERVTCNVPFVAYSGNSVNRPAEDTCLRSGADNCGVWEFSSGPGVSTTLLSDGKGSGMSGRVSSDVWYDRDLLELSLVI